MNLLRRSRFFLSQRLRRWRWPWFLLALFAAGLGLVFLSLVLIVALELLAEFGPAWMRDFDFIELETFTKPPHVALELLLVGIPFWGAAIIGTLVQGRSIGSLLAPLHRFRWGLVGKVLILEVVLQVALNFLPIPLVGAEDPVVNFTGLRLAHALWLLPMIVIIFIQTSGEDVFFKGYLLRQLGAMTVICWIAPLLVVSVFVLGHVGNADLEQNAWLFLPMFLLSEAVIITLLIRTQGMEIPLVLHWFNNFTLMFIYGEAGTQSNDLTLWVRERSEDEAIALAGDVESVIAYVIYLGALLLFLLWPRSPFYVGPAAEIELPAESPPPVPPPLVAGFEDLGGVGEGEES